MNKLVQKYKIRFVYKLRHSEMYTYLTDRQDADGMYIESSCVHDAAYFPPEMAEKLRGYVEFCPDQDVEVFAITSDIVS